MKKLSKKEQTELLYLGAGVTLLIVIFVLVKKFNSRKKHSLGVGPGETPAASSGTGYTKVSCDKSTVLKKGIECDAVMYSQKQINMIHSSLGIAKLTEDGKFGDKTETAFKKLLGKPTGTFSEVVSARKLK